MTVYFVQHGLALTKEEDPNRPLSQTGKLEVKSISQYLQTQGIKINGVYHSGKTRAEETAQIFANQIGDGNVNQLIGMNPNDDVREFATILKFENTMYIGHLPHLEKLISFLITGSTNTNVVKLVNAGVVCVEKNSLGYYIDWYLKPSLCKL